MNIMKETKPVSHLLASKLLHNKFVVVLGDSIQRSVYKDLVLLLQKDKYLSLKQLKMRGEMSFELDCLVEGGCLNQMSNGTQYREVRQYQADHHLLRYYFITRIFSGYMQSIIDDFRHGIKPDVVIVNSCVWDISRYSPRWVKDYKENLSKFFSELKAVLPEETLIIWNLAMPLGERIKGGFLVPEIEHKAPQLRFDVVEANFFSATLADAFEMDVLDLHFQFRCSLQHRTNDGVHWNAIAHRRITSLLLQHIAQAWGVTLPSSERANVADLRPFLRINPQPAAEGRSNHSEFADDSLPCGFLSFENKKAHDCRRENAENVRPVGKTLIPRQEFAHRKAGNWTTSYTDVDYSPHDWAAHQHERRHPSRQRFAPYSHHRPAQHR